jgi:hypothetical protein
MRWIEAREASQGMARLRRLTRVLVCWLNRLDAAPVAGRAVAPSAEGSIHDLHRMAAELRHGQEAGFAGRLRRGVRAIMWPVLAAAVAGPVLARCGPRVRDRYGRTLREQWADLWDAVWRHGIMPTEYYQRRVFHGRAADNKALYLKERELGALLAAADRGADVARIDHVCRFLAECRGANLPVPKVAAVFSGGGVETAGECGADRALPEKDLLLRPEKWGVGEAGQHWRWNAQRRAWSFEDRVLGGAELLRLGASLSHRGPWLLLEAVHNHPEMSRFTAGGLCSVRIATGIDDEGGPMPLFASMMLQSMALGGRVCGVLTAGVEMDRGVLTAAWGESMADGEFESHPDTGSVIAGAVVPQWAGIVDLAVRAHRRFADVPFVSWEVAVGGSGPVLLEASSHLGAFDHVLPAETAFARLCMRRIEQTGRAGSGGDVSAEAAREARSWQRQQARGATRHAAHSWPRA